MNAKRIETGVRLLLALALTAFGADKFFHFMPVPEAPPEGGAYLGALTDTGYIFPIIGGVFIAAALCLVSKRVLLGLMLVSPILVNIVAYHVRYDLPGIAGGAVLSALVLILFMLHTRNLGALFGANQVGKQS
jgi:putative oxidoreductase